MTWRKQSAKKSHKGRWRREIITEKRAEIKKSVGETQIMGARRMDGFTEQDSWMLRING